MTDEITLALISAVVGGVITYVFTLLINIERSKNAIREKVIANKLQCLDQMFYIAKTLRLTMSENNVNIKNDVITYPIILSNRNEYDKFRVIFAHFTNDHSHWLSNKLNKEVLLLQDYFLNLDAVIYKNLPIQEKLPQLGVIIKQDFKNFSVKIEAEICKTYKSSYMRRIIFPKKKNRSKYTDLYSIKYIDRTMLKERADEIYQLTCNESNS